MTVRPVTLALLGDVMLGRLVSEELELHPPEWFWGSTLPVLRRADAVIANLECAVTASERPWRRSPKVFHFRAAPAAIEVLKAGNVRCVSLANNHTLDFEVEGLMDTLRLLDAAGIKHVGAGGDAASAAAPALLEVAGATVGIIAITDNEPEFAAHADAPGVNYMQISAHSTDYARIVRATAALRAKGAQVVILSAHWGPNMVQVPSNRFQAFARLLVSDCVDLFHGHSAHLFQAVELVGRGAVLYDTGDYLDDYAIDPLLRNDWSFIFLVEIDADGVRRLRLLPVRLSFAQTNLAEGKTFDAICTRMESLCEEFDTPVTRTKEGLEIRLRVDA